MHANGSWTKRYINETISDKRLDEYYYKCWSENTQFACDDKIFLKNTFQKRNFNNVTTAVAAV